MKENTTKMKFRKEGQIGDRSNKIKAIKEPGLAFKELGRIHNLIDQRFKSVENSIECNFNVDTSRVQSAKFK